MKHKRIFYMSKKTQLNMMLFAVGMMAISSVIHAQSVNYNEQTRPPNEEKQETSAQPNRNGVFEGINIMDNTVVISGKGYPAVINPSRIPTLANGNSMPPTMIPEGARIQFNVDNDGRVTAIWVDGDLTH